MNPNRTSFLPGASQTQSDLATPSPQAGGLAAPAPDPAPAEIDAPFLPARLAWVCGSVVTSRRMAESA